MAKRFSQLLKKGLTFKKRSSHKNVENSREQLCHKCGSPDHFIKFCLLQAVEYKKNNPEKAKEDIYSQ